MKTPLASVSITAARTLVLLLAAGALFEACSSASVRTMPGENGVIRIVAKDTSKEGAEEAAADKAADYCKDRGQEAVFTKDGTKYTGDMDENTRNNVKKASNVAWMLGGVNSPVHDAATAGHVWTSGRDYEAEVLFRCK